MPLFVVLILLASTSCFGQTVALLKAPRTRLPASIVDGNSPGVWVDGTFRVYTSPGDPLAMSGPDVFTLSNANPPLLSSQDHMPIWIESVWRDEDGTVYGWYHHEPGGLCPGGELTAPEIGALVSFDGGESFEDLGIVLQSGYAPNCSAKNGFFAGGHGDFSVVLDRERNFFYFLFSNYGGPAARQGVSIARMPFDDRAQPVGAVFKFADGSWNEPGLGGQVTPILPVRTAWEHEDADAYWGPAIHWNTAIERYVVLLNRACCKPRWPQEGIYLMFGTDLSDPKTWTSPRRLMSGEQAGGGSSYYPQVFGDGPGESDSEAGERPRLFIKGVSDWALQFYPLEPGGRKPEPILVEE